MDLCLSYTLMLTRNGWQELGKLFFCLHGTFDCTGWCGPFSVSVNLQRLLFVLFLKNRVVLFSLEMVWFLCPGAMLKERDLEHQGSRKTSLREGKERICTTSWCLTSWRREDENGTGAKVLECNIELSHGNHTPSRQWKWRWEVLVCQQASLLSCRDGKKCEMVQD